MKLSVTIIFCVLSLLSFAQNKSFDLSQKVSITETVGPQKITSITLFNALAKTGTTRNR